MRILYYSVHQILEFDEIQIFQKLGYDVFSLGVYFSTTPSQNFRPKIYFTSSKYELMSKFIRMGGVYKYGAPASEQIIPREFVELFDAVVVMHDFDFIEQHWSALSASNVIWRSIGVGTQLFETRVAELRKLGCRVVRYCPTEQLANGYAGHDAIIRFGKILTNLARTQGSDKILTFSHYFSARFPQEYAFYEKAVVDLNNVLCGDGNAGLKGSIGIVDFAQQVDLLANCCAYYYAGGTFIPYTLNFMEAWLSGIPVVATDCRAVHDPHHCVFAEVPKLIKSGFNGFLCATPEEATQCFRALIADPDMAREIGVQGAKDAEAYFSADVVAPQWKAFLENILGPSRP